MICRTGMTYADFARWARTQTLETLRCDVPPSEQHMEIFDSVGIEKVEAWLDRFIASELT